MATIYESAEYAMNGLWKQGDEYLRSFVDFGLADIDEITEFGRLQLVSSDNEDLVVCRYVDELDIEGTVEETKNGKLIDVSYRVQWDWDMRNLPKVYKDEWKGNQSHNVGTVPQREFPLVAQSIGRLLSQLNLATD